MKKRALAVMLAGVMVLGAQTGVWAASDTSDQKEGELTLLMTNSWIDESGASSEEFLKAIKQYEEENPGVKITLQGASQQDIKESFQTAALAVSSSSVVSSSNGYRSPIAARSMACPELSIITMSAPPPARAAVWKDSLISYWESMFLQHGKNFLMQ